MSGSYQKSAIFAFASALAGSVLLSSPAQALVKLDPGNQNSEQPAIPGASKNRTKALKTSFDKKYQKVLRLLQNDKRLIADIKSTSKKFDIDPIHMIGAIVGEHTYNVDALDRAQSYYIKALSYVKSDIDFEYDGETISEFVERPQFEPCLEFETSLALWTCRENIWNAEFRGKKVDGTAYPNNRFSAVFFQPFYAGQTFGIGQLNPLTALMMTDKVSEVTGSRKIDVADGKAVYGTIMDPKKTLPYIAATLASSIDAYKSYAGFDISANPGITATLYNTGSPIARAQALLEKNKKRIAQGETPIMPQENYYGWLINDREEELRSLF
ncbi:MAG: DUF1402 family protein [Pseudomonadota bacterium]